MQLYTLREVMIYYYGKIGEIVLDIIQDVEDGILSDKDGELVKRGVEFLSKL